MAIETGTGEKHFAVGQGISNRRSWLSSLWCVCVAVCNYAAIDVFFSFASNGPPECSAHALTQNF
jgi:hypothetical protein